MYSLCYLLTSSLEFWLSTLITIINIRCSEISNVLFDYNSTDFLVCINIAPRNNGCGACEFSVNFSNSFREFSVKFGRFWKRYREIAHFSPWIRLVPTHLHSTPPLGGGVLSQYCREVWYGKTRMVWLPVLQIFSRYDYSFWQNPQTWQTGRHRMTA